MRRRGYFDEAKAEQAVRFVRSLKHTKGRWAGVPFNLQPFQEKRIREIFGRLNADGTRQYRIVYLEEPRKNGKSEEAAAVGLKLLAADGGRPLLIGAAVNFGAATEAARRAFEEAGELTILCAGREKGFALEDAYAAGRFVEAIVPGRLRRGLDITDAVIASRELVRKFGTDWKKAVTASAHARYLKERNFAKDVAFAAQADVFSLVPVYADRRITLPDRG